MLFCNHLNSLSKNLMNKLSYQYNYTHLTELSKPDIKN